MLVTSADIAEEALRQVGVLSATDTAATPEEFSIALTRLAFLIDELNATEQLQFFRPENQIFDLEANKEDEYALTGLLSTKLQFIAQVFLVEPNGRKTMIEQKRREVFDDEAYAPSARGIPSICYIETSNNPTIKFFPTIAVDDYTIEISGFKFGDDVTIEQGRTVHGFPSGWQLGLIYMLAADLGDGPITTLETVKIERMLKIGGQKLRKLQSRQNKEQVRRPRVTQMRSF